MCRYCEQKKDGGVDVLKMTIPCGAVGVMEVALNFNTYEPTEAYAYLSTWLSIGEGQGKTLDYDDVDVNYCFHCGRDLKNAE